MPTAELASSIPLKSPTSIVLSADGKYAYVADASLGEVISIPTGGGAASVVSITGLTTALNNPTGLALSGGTLYVSDSGNNRIIAVATSGGVGKVVGSQVPLTGNQGICALPNGNLLVANTQSSSLVVLNPVNGAATTLPVFDTIKGTPFVHPISVAVSRDGGTYFVGLTGNAGSGTVVEMNSAGGNFSVVSSGIQGLNAIALSGAGQLAFNGNQGVSTEAFR
jgi:sugar lactone lactonase YvrE